VVVGKKRKTNAAVEKNKTQNNLGQVSLPLNREQSSVVPKINKSCWNYEVILDLLIYIFFYFHALCFVEFNALTFIHGVSS
jgi:hypothetical protein